MTTVQRLLSPQRRRIYPNPTSHSEQMSDTLICLSKAGWRPYEGPAQTDDRGYIVPGSDPAIVPLGPTIHDPRWDGAR